MSTSNPKILVSACLLGRKVRYDGKSSTYDDDILERWIAENRVIPFCPEVAGGLPVPRPPAEIQSHDGHAVLDGYAKILANDGRDVTSYFLKGARQCLELALRERVKLAILKARSPSCGNHQIYDGTFSGALKRGIGVTAALLERHGIRAFNENELHLAKEFFQF